eukprot:TRINITY_DN1874_c2_g1_i1.p1 TRINITY_DN1874_c2_g1~~TRINITY_DN1874_c2_g1_i1.p1  ORF type:complete len:216 (-),score=34.71 TRINITY_DN1874_c2_g1_i1:56-703(-)
MLKKAYLIAYNGAQVVGWSYVVFLMVMNLLNSEDPIPTMYDVCGPFLTLFQNAALMEVIHAFTGVVPSNPMTALTQIASRILVVYLANATTDSSHSIFYTIILTAWGVTEIIRYSFYTLNELGGVPYPLLWLRYSTFYILYPLGVIGEMGIVYTSLNHFTTTQALSIAMPNVFNFAFNFAYFLAILLPIYPPGLLFMMNHMRHQRKKQLGKAKQQ